MMQEKVLVMKTRQIGATLATMRGVRQEWMMQDELPGWAHGVPAWKLNVVLDQLELNAGWWHTALVEGSAKVWRALEQV
jgi:hypothetical protein